MWERQLKFDPLPLLVHADHQPLRYFARRDLLDEPVENIECLWQSPEVRKILKRQLDTGAWKYPGGGSPHLRSVEDYNQLETYRILGILVEKFGLNASHPAIRRTANYLFSHQTEAGDFRGIYGNQFTPNYSAAILELLIKAGYSDDPHVERGIQWLFSVRQQDGGWAIPLRTSGQNFNDKTLKAETILPDTSRPFSHLVTGIVLRALAAHPYYRTTGDVQRAGELLASRFFKPDKYSDRRAISFWTGFSYPFWQTDLLSSLDSLSLIGFKGDHPQVKKALNWFVTRQDQDGSWQLKLLRGDKHYGHLWVSLAICRVFKRMG